MIRPLPGIILVCASAALAGGLAGEVWAQQDTRIELRCPPDTVVACNRLSDTTGTPATATGGCGAVSLSYDDSTLPGAAPDRFTITRTWSAADTCGQRQSCVQTIQIVPSRPRIAVLSFENLAESEEGARIFARLMQDQLAQFPQFDVIPAGEVETTVLRARIRLPVLMDNEQSRHLQQALDADYFVLGTVIAYQTNQDPYAGPVPIAGISLQLRDARTGATVWSDTFHENGSAGEWLFGLGVEHDITRLAHSIARRAAGRLERITRLFPCGQIAP